MQTKQETYWNKIKQEYPLRWRFMRQYLLYFISDAALIEHSLHGDQKLYLKVQQKIAQAFENCLAALGNDINKPVILVCHSLGGQQLANYIWDAKHNLRYFAIDHNIPAEQAEFRKLHSCAAMFTLGCNIPVFKVGLEEIAVFPQPNNFFQWYNLFDRDDILGYPLKPLAPAFDVPWIHDQLVNVGNWFTRWNPTSHAQYWHDKNVIKPIGELIKQLL